MNRRRAIRLLAALQVLAVCCLAAGAGAWLSARDSAVAQGPIRDLTPPGAIVPLATPAAPSGYLLAHGQAVARGDYPELFAAIGTAYGAGDGSTTFNVPDLRGRAAAGRDAMGSQPSAGRLTSGGSGINGTSLGAAGGADGVSLSTSQMPSHGHGVYDSGHQHEIRTNHNGDFIGPCCGGGRGGWGMSSNWGVNNNIYHWYAPTASANISAYNSGSGSTHVNMQPSLVVTYAIRAA